MGGWDLDLTVISASDLLNVRKKGKMKVYAKVSINGKPKWTWKTPVDPEGGTNPRWDMKTPFTLSDESVEGDTDMLVINLFCGRTLQRDKYVGELNLPLKTLFEERNGEKLKSGDWDVSRVNEDGRFGVLKLSYRFSEAVVKISRGSRSSSSSSHRSDENRTRKGIKGIAKAAGSITVAVASSVAPIVVTD